MKTLAGRIREDVESQILSGGWPPGHRIPFEHELAIHYGCSRMTVNKVISWLASSGLIVRRRRAGSFVAMPGAERALIAIENFAEEAARLGVSYHYEMRHRSIELPEPSERYELRLDETQELLRVWGRHHYGDAVIANEERIISLNSLPQARDEPFDAIPPGTWLSRRLPWTQAEHVILARNAEADLAEALEVAEGTACLVLERRTLLRGELVSFVRTTYPGDRYRFAGRFSPTR